MIKALREETGLSVMQCQKALEAASGNREKALEILKEKGNDFALKKSERNLGAGTVASYIHAGETVGAMVELLSETDFVAKNPEFRSIAKDIAMHVAAMNPQDMAELLNQPFIKGKGETIGDMINGTALKFGERTELGKYIRFSIK